MHEAHEQNAITVACHPHDKVNEDVHPNMHLWNNRKKYRSLLDVWEIANREDLYDVVAVEKLNYVANSDFHQPNHIYSWKTLVRSEKNVEATKEALRKNTDIGIYLTKSKPSLTDEKMIPPLVATIFK